MNYSLKFLSLDKSCSKGISHFYELDNLEDILEVLMFEYILKLYCHHCDKVFFCSSEQRIYSYLKFKVNCPFCIEEPPIPDDYRGQRHLLPESRLGIYECSRDMPQINQNNTTPIEYC